METTINQRIEMVASKFAKNQSDFAKKIGKPSQTISNIIAGRSNPSFEVIQAILEIFPQIDPFWLILGKGNSQFVEKSPPDKYVISLEDRVAEQAATIRVLLGKSGNVSLAGTYSFFLTIVVTFVVHSKPTWFIQL
ncbi:helix-turn-helix transcriptional regulator [Runella slithyformis]|nr:helix-turn-helix transcriptional regulator [Runella slithyformis]